MENNLLEKNNKIGKELNTNEEVNIKTKIFSFFNYVLKKKDINMLLCNLFIIIEMIQMISFAFSSPHTSLWKVDTNTMYYVQLVVTSTRIAPLMVFLTFNWYLIIYCCMLGYIFLHSLSFAMALRINKISSKFYQINISFTRYFINAISIFLFIPISELLLSMMNCSNGSIIYFTDSITCWTGLHILYSFLSVIFSCLFYLLVLVLTIFYFYPFNGKKTSTKIDTSGETFWLILKALSVIRFIGVNSSWVAIVFMVISALLNAKRGYENPTYNNYLLECMISIRNTAILWTYIVLFICKVLEGSTFNGQIYLLILGYPLIVILSITYYKKKSLNFVINNTNFTDANEILDKLKYFKQLIESFLSRNKSSKSMKSNNMKKNEILLKGYVTIHEESCINDECPLKKFLENSGNFNVQKIALLHYINSMFNEGIKKFPNSKVLMMNFVQFNYEKKYNLNSAKTYLTKLERSQNTMREDFIIYCIKQNINTINNKLYRSYTNEEEMLKVEDTTEHKFKRLKVLIESAAKLYGEFWGSLSTNLTNNLNLKKLFFVGNKLNQILNEINQLWENELKHKKIDLENQSIVQLYAYFIREILKNTKKSDEISKKLNEEHHFENKMSETDKIDFDNLDLLLENQDLVLYSRTNEKGEAHIIQCSNAVVSMFGYTKQEIIGKKIEYLMPVVYHADHNKNLSSKIKTLRSSYNYQKNIFINTDKKQIFILPKTKLGYIIPINSKFTIYNDDDFSSTFIIKSKFELKDTKSIYAFYILTKEDFTLDSISSSCLNLNLSMDLLKKYLVNINYLIRDEYNQEMDFSEKFNEYEEEPKKVVWVFPDLLYPKGDNMDIMRKSDDEREELISSSHKKEFNLLITRLYFRNENTLGYCFRLTQIEQRRRFQDNFDYKLNFNNNKVLMYDMKKLNFLRTMLVNEKSRVEKPEETLHSPLLSKNEYKLRTSIKKTDKKRRRKDSKSDSSEPEEDRIIEDNIITKEKLQEFQTKTSDDIRAYINSLANFGDNISLFKRDTEFKNSYEDHYNKVSLIKQTMEEFLKKMLNKKNNNLEKRIEKKTGEVPTNNSSSITADLGGHEFISDTSSSLNNIFNEKSIANIKWYAFIVFMLLLGVITAEFFISLRYIQQSNTKIINTDKAFTILDSILYTKFFLTEAVLTATKNYTNFDSSYKGNRTLYFNDIINEMSKYHETISDTYDYFTKGTNTFNDNYNNFVNNQLLYIRTLSNGNPIYNYLPFTSGITSLTVSIFDISNVNNDINSINMTNRNVYELMMNMLNDYLLNWRRLTFILVDDAMTYTNGDSTLTYILGFSVLMSAMSLIMLKKYINQFVDDQEKPVDLFLTIKKQKFEELKYSSEAFLNKLLNKFFGNEEAEEEMLSDSMINIKSDDINIAKFKQKNDYKQSIRTSSEYVLIFVRILIFFAIFLGYMIFKFQYVRTGLQSMQHYTDVFNYTRYSQADMVLSIDAIKSFYLDPSIPIYNSTKTQEIFKNTTVGISDMLESMIMKTYTNMDYLNSDYLDSFMQNLNQDICGLIPSISNTTQCDSQYLGSLRYGFKAIGVRYFDLLRFLAIRYLSDDSLPILFQPEFIEIDNILRNVIRSWYKNLLTLLLGLLTDYYNQINLIIVSIYVVLVVSIVILYFLVWKSFEDNLKELLKTSVDLINLIPESITYKIVERINEDEESKKE